MKNSATISQSTIKTTPTRVKKNLLANAAVQLKATRQAKKIMAALEEVKKIQEGKAAPKSFDDFLNEL